MTISSETRVAGPFIGTGLIATYPFAFKVFAAADLYVVQTDDDGADSLLVLNSDYTVSLNADQNSNPGGNVVLDAVLAADFKLTVTSDIAYLQPVDLTNQGGFYPSVINAALDRLTIFAQQLADKAKRSLKFPVSDGVTSDVLLPNETERAGMFLAFDAGGNPVASFGIGSDSDLRADLAASGGSALVEHAGGTLAAYLDGLDEQLAELIVQSGDQQGFVAGQNIDAELAAWIMAYANTGTVIKLRPGTYTITAHYEIEGWTLDLSAGAEIECNGSDDTLFGSGFLEVVAGGRIVGGTVYTSGTMTGTYNASYTARSCVLLCNGGEIDGTTVYSQINTGIKHYSGKLKKPLVIGSHWNGFNCYWTSDISHDIDVRTFNTGVRYIAKVAQASGNTSNVFACLIWFTLDITRQVLLKFSGEYSSANGLWLESSARGTITMDNLIVEAPTFNHAGRYLANGTTSTVGNLSGTGIEIISAPNVTIIDPNSNDALGYNLAISYCPNGVSHGGISKNGGNDPNVVIVDSDEFTMYDHYAEGGTTGFSIGEDGATSHDVKLIGCTGKDNGYGPIRFTYHESGCKLFIDRFTAINGADVTEYTGTFAGPGQLRDMCRVVSYSGSGATGGHVSLTNSTLAGFFTEIFRCGMNGDTVSIYENNNAYSCPFVPPPIGELFRARGQYNTPSTAIPLITGSTGGRANVGTITVSAATVSTSVALSVTDIEPYVGTQAAASFDATDWYMLFYVQITADINGQLQIGLDDSGGTDAGRIQFTCYFDEAIANFDSRFASDLVVGEWLPFAINLRNAVYSGVTDFGALTRIQLAKAAYSPNYELIMTRPVIVMRKAIA